ncbi:MAG: PDR/VanB family oxidoreductase [Alphaproteobacteria bacterium]|nr:PDR/VanB family oxidoreductase [Alphaproteobacteria bacterium]
MSDLELKVTAIEELTPSIKMFEFVNAQGGDLPAFQAGAHIDVRTGAGVIRSYSLCNDPKERHRYVTAVLRETEGGGGSKWMHDELKVGDVVTTSPPLQNFPLDERAPLSILLAGGIGITPLLAMGHRLKAQRLPCHLHYCTKSPEETAFMEEVKALFGDDVTFHHDGGDPSKGIDLKATFAQRPEGAHLYICGPAGLIRAAQEASDHWPEEAVHIELFTSARTEEEAAEIAARSADDEGFEVELARSGQTLTIPPDKSILDVLIDNGFGVPYACEEGWCGACVIDLLGGKADHRDEVLSDAEKESNSKIQVCVSRAKPGEKLVLDL